MELSEIGVLSFDLPTYGTDVLQLVTFLLLTTGLERNEEFAVLDYWLRLRVPMEQALRLYKVNLFCIHFLGR